MALRRRLRETASPSPGPQSGASTPLRDPLTRRVVADRGGTVRSPMPAKYSTAYGSPMTQLPDRSTVGGGGGVTKAAAEIFTKVKKDNVAAEARRRVKDQTRAARAGTRVANASSPPPTIQPTIEVGGEEEETDELEEQSEEEGSEYEDQPAPQSEVRRSPRKGAPRKRAHDDEEAEARIEQERKERDARLKRERSAEARKLKAQKMAEARTAAQEKAEQERPAEPAAREEAGKAAMPPPPHPPERRLRDTEAVMTPARDALLAGLTPRPPSARSFVEEGNIFGDASFQTPINGPGPPTPVPPAQAALPSSRRTEPAVAPPETVSPPSVLKRPPRRPGGATPGPRIQLTTSPGRRRDTTQETSSSEEFSVSDNEGESVQTSPSDQYTAPSIVARAHTRLKTLPTRVEADNEYEESIRTDGEKPDESFSSGDAYDRRRRWSSGKHPLSPWPIFKIAAVAFVMLHLFRLGHTLLRPDLFETPVWTLSWYGWKDWTSNVGQFFPSPLLHPLGVLTNDQYDDLKDYLQRRTTTIEAMVGDLKSIVPNVVSVRKDKKGKILIADEFWNALKDRIQHDDKLISLDAKSRISEKHWKAIQQRLKEAGLLGKPLSSEDVTRIVEKTAPSSWEKWLKENQQKIADVLGESKSKLSPTAKSRDGAVVTREEFLRELKDHLTQNKKQIDSEMDNLRKELHGLLHEVRATASAGGMTKAEIRALIKDIVDKEVVRRQINAASKSGAATVDATLRRQLNHFCPGNSAMVDISMTSPTYRIKTPPLGSKEWLKSMRTQPQFLADQVHALTPWVDAGQCWCGGILRDNNRTHPAAIAVRLRSFVIPQYIVLEHIDPAATTDALSMPRDVEVWAVFDEHARRERVLDWMAAAFPNDMNDQLVTKGLAKIGQFTYEHRPQDEGVYVHKLSEKLDDTLKAATDLVLVRAVTNYGAKDHTCFYRVRMYGEVVELEAEKKSKDW